MSDDVELPTFSLTNLLLVATSILLVWTTLFAAVRVWAKTQSQWHWADNVFLVGYALCAAQCAAIFLAIGRYGFGAEVASDPARWKQALYASELLYVLSVGTSKCSTALFLKNLSRDKKDNSVGIAIAAFAALWTVVSVLVVGLRGDLTAPWSSDSSFFGRWLGVEIIGMLVEVGLWAFSVMLIWRLNMRVQRRVKLLLIFAARLLLLPAVILRLWRLGPSVYDGSTDMIVSVNILTQIVMHAALLSECMTCLKPFLQTFHEGVAMPGGASSYWGNLTIVSQVKSGGSKGSKGNNMKYMEKSWQENSGDHGLRPIADRATITTKIMSDRKDRRSQREEGDDDIELLPSSAIHVQRTTTVSGFR